jgi:hypothetical protein
MFLGDRRTTRSIHAFRSPRDSVRIPTGAILHDVRTNNVRGYPFPRATTIMPQRHASMYIFEFSGETLYVHFRYGLIEATTKVSPSK